MLDAIAHELGDLPLALHLTGSYLKRYERTAAGRPDAYLDALLQPALLAHPSLTIGGRNPTGHEQHVARTFQLSLDRLDPNDAIDTLARAALIHAAHLAPGVPVPAWLLGRILALDPADEAGERRLADALSRLADLGLIETEAGSPLLHRLVAAFARDCDSTAEGRTSVEAAIAAVAAKQNNTGLPGPLLAWQPHLRHVAHTAAKQGGEYAGDLTNSLGYHLRMVADYAGAMQAHEHALAIDEAAYGPDHPSVAIRVNNLGGSWRSATCPPPAKPSSAPWPSTKPPTAQTTPMSPSASTIWAGCFWPSVTCPPPGKPASAP